VPERRVPALDDIRAYGLRIGTRLLALGEAEVRASAFSVGQVFRRRVS
jgi:hypothetical protein